MRRKAVREGRGSGAPSFPGPSIPPVHAGATGQPDAAPLSVRPVRGRRDAEAFLRFPFVLYSGDPNWTPPPLGARRARFDPRHGVFLRRGALLERFLAYQGPTLVGTICAAFDPEHSNDLGRRDCVIGFLDYVDDAEVLHALLAAAEGFARAHGLERLVGPFDLDYEDGYGVLVEGRETRAAALCGWSAPYYRERMEAAGFLPYRPDNLAFDLDLAAPNPELDKVERAAGRIARSGRVSVRGARMDELEGEAAKVHGLLNEALAHLSDFAPWSLDSVVAMFRDFKRFADPELVLFAEAEGRAIGWFGAIPDLNEALAGAGGLRSPLGWARFLLALRRPRRRLCLKSVLVSPDWWAKGASLLLMAELVARAKAKGYRALDFSLTSDDNPYTPALALRLGARLSKRYRTYAREVSPAGPGAKA